MNAEKAGKAGRVALLYIGLVAVLFYGAILVAAPVCIWKLYQKNATLVARISTLEAQAEKQAKAGLPRVEPMIAPVVLNFYGNAELVPRGQRPKTKTY